jgi:hypothetical protein
MTVSRLGGYSKVGIGGSDARTLGDVVLFLSVDLPNTILSRQARDNHLCLVGYYPC